MDDANTIVIQEAFGGWRTKPRDFFRDKQIAKTRLDHRLKELISHWVLSQRKVYHCISIAGFDSRTECHEAYDIVGYRINYIIADPNAPLMFVTSCEIEPPVFCESRWSRFKKWLCRK